MKRASPYKTKGFTMIEVIIAVVIVAILVAIAIPSYLNYVQKSRRTDATHTILAIQLAQEKYRITNNTYGTLAQVWGGVTTSEGGYYTMAVSNNTATTYTITATAGSSQSGDTEGGSACNTLTLTYANGTSTKTPAACWVND